MLAPVAAQGYPHGTLELVRSAPDPVPPQAYTTNNTMTWTPSATRADVERVVARYVRMEFSIPSQAGRVVIHDSRAAQKQSLQVGADCSDAEFLDALRLTILRRAIYAKPRDPKFDVQDGALLHRVVPLRDSAQVVRSRPSRQAGQDASNARDWRATIAQKLAKLSRKEADALTEVETLRIALQETGNLLEAARSTAERLKAGRRRARHNAAASSVASIIVALEARERVSASRLSRLLAAPDHQRGLDQLLAICTETRDIEAYVFRHGSLEEA